MGKKSLIQGYVNGWINGNAQEILDPLSDDCIITESHGPVYRGKAVIKTWIADWLKRGNRVEKWTITSFYTMQGRVVFEWFFSYKGPHTQEAFEGITIAQIVDGKISTLREYRATAFPYLQKFFIEQALF